MEHLEHNWEQQREQLSALLDNALNAQERAELEAHLATCAECRAELASLQRARALLRALPQPTLPRSFALPLEAAPIPAQTLRAVPAAHPVRQRASAPPARSANPRRPVHILQWISTSAALLGIVVLLSGVFTSHTFTSGAATTASNSTNQPASSAGQAGSTPQRTPARTQPGTTNPIPTAVTPNVTPGANGHQPISPANPTGSTGSAFEALISSTGLGILLLLLSACGFAIAWALRRRW